LLQQSIPAATGTFAPQFNAPAQLPFAALAQQQQQRSSGGVMHSAEEQVMAPVVGFAPTSSPAMGAPTPIGTNPSMQMQMQMQMQMLEM